MRCRLPDLDQLRRRDYPSQRDFHVRLASRILRIGRSSSPRPESPPEPGRPEPSLRFVQSAASPR
jgi:hypothetical protein